MTKKEEKKMKKTEAKVQVPVMTREEKNARVIKFMKQRLIDKREELVEAKKRL